MSDIDPLYFLTPIIVITFSFGIVIYWHFKSRLTSNVLLYSLLAYAGAIFIKYIFQTFTLASFTGFVNGNLYALGAYYGLQTVVLEVGFAVLLAYYGAKHGIFKRSDATGYGLGLGLWENGVLVSIPLLIDYITYYALAPGNSALHLTLINLAPALFLGPAKALPQVALAILERISSELSHFAWGYLAVLGAVTGRKLYWIAAFPMGLLDFLVPFAPNLGELAFEGIIFAIALASILIALALGRRAKDAPLSDAKPRGRYMSLSRAISYSKIYLIVGIAISLVLGLELGVAAGSAKVILTVTNSYLILLLLTALIGSMGGLMIFISDKQKVCS